MTLLRAQAEGILVRRVGALLTAAGLDGTTTTGSNADLSDPLLVALLRLGHTAIADVASITDDDLSAVPVTELEAFLDLTEYRALETILGNLDDVDIRVGPRYEYLSQLAEQVRHKMERLRRTLMDVHGIAAGTMEMGVIDLGFVARGDDEIVVDDG